ncbi:MAG: sigma-54 dependent transcriptional regulator [Prevotella sp.]|nr:sigma-54 dependent transcriptional regulator [Prevotella sp.]
MKQGCLLIADDNRNILTTVKLLAEGVFARIVTTASPDSIPARLREDRPDVVLLDMNFHSGINNGNEGLYWLRTIRHQRPQTQVVLFTAYADIQLAVNGLKEGAADFIVKPFDNDQMVETLRNAYLKTQPCKAGNKNESGMFWGSSPAMTTLRAMVEKVAATSANILITGENGTGKEVLANEIHRLSQRATGPMVAIDLGAVSESLFESELFGHVKGAFTDAKTDKPGKMELAEGGTLFLDEIGNLSYSLQAKLLTALQSHRITRVGGQRQIDINVRLVCATNRDLAQMVSQGQFREDLLYRINTIHLKLPPLRERQGDIVPLAQHFLDRYASMYGKQKMTFAEEAKKKIEALPWYGNIRELQHAIEKAVILCDANEISDELIEGSPIHTDSQAQAVQTLDEMEKQMIAKAIQECCGNLSQVAQRLGITRQTLYNKIKKYNL